MALRAYKFLLRVGLLEEDDDGVIRGEHETEPVLFYGADQLMTWLGDLDAVVTQLDGARVAEAPPAVGSRS